MSNNVAIKLDNVSMHFNMATQKYDSLKEYVIKFVKKELFFKEFIAVEDVSIEIPKGEVFGIVGTNGSGKSTLLKIISGILKPTKGTVVVQGNIAPLIELGAGFDGELTARENIYLNGAVLGYSKKFIDEHFNNIVDFAELWDFLDVPIKNYSSGMVARIAFAIATVIKPDILIVDEILSVGDFLFQQKCENRIKELMNDNVTVLIVSHSIGQIEKLCDRVMWIEKSKPVMIGKTFDVCNAYRNLQNDKRHEDLHKNFDIVTKELCYVCGSKSDFRVEKGVTLKREASCNFCGSSLRNSDVAHFIVKSFCDNNLKGLRENEDILRKLSILNCSEGGVIHNVLNGLPKYNNFINDTSILSGGINPMPYKDNMFDLIISEDVLPHTTNLPFLLEEINRVLKPNGKHIFTVPLHESHLTEFRRNKIDILRTEPIRGDGIKVTVDFGDDISDILEKFGFKTTIDFAHNFYMPNEITVIDDIYEKCKDMHPFYYYKYNSVVMVSQKIGS